MEWSGVNARSKCKCKCNGALLTRSVTEPAPQYSMTSCERRHRAVAVAVERSGCGRGLSTGSAQGLSEIAWIAPYAWPHLTSPNAQAQQAARRRRALLYIVRVCISMSRRVTSELLGRGMSGNLHVQRKSSRGAGAGRTQSWSSFWWPRGPGVGTAGTGPACGPFLMYAA